MRKIQEELQSTKPSEDGTLPLIEKPKEGTHLPMYLRPADGDEESYTQYYEDLKVNLRSYHHDKSIKTILFLGTAHGEGVSTTAINFASMLARDSQLDVLLIEANLRNPSLDEVFNVDSSQNPSGFPTDGNKSHGGFKKVGPENLYVVTPGSKLSGPLSLFESQRFWEFLKTMREEFDFVILDGPPLPTFSESKVICSKVDGVVMVVETGKTRKQVALRAKKEIEKAGGTVLGVVLNKRKFHIPKWIYQRM